MTVVTIMTINLRRYKSVSYASIKISQRTLGSSPSETRKEYGTSYEEEASYYSNEFGIEPCGDERIGQVYDFFSGQGCAKVMNADNN